MGIGSVTSSNSISGMQMTMASSTDTKSKNIQNEIKGMQQQMQKLSSKEGLSVNEKTNERKKLQKEISSLNTELKQHQEELRKSQKREIMMAELLEDSKPEKEEQSEDKIQTKETSLDQADKKNPLTDKQHAGDQGSVMIQNSDGIVTLKGTVNQDENRSVNQTQKQAEESSSNKADAPREKVIAEKEAEANADDDTKTGLSKKEIHAISSADTSTQQAGRQEIVIARIRGGIAILKGEMNQDEKRDVNTDRKQAELEKLEKKEERARAFQFSILGEANHTMKSAAKANVSDEKDKEQANAKNNAYMNASGLSREESQSQVLQQKFYVSFS